jgi:hypothetical protein
MPEDIHSLVGYERRLYKMRRPELLAEAKRVGLSLTETQKSIMLLSDLVKRILEIQGMNDNILINPPPRKKP